MSRRSMAVVSVVALALLPASCGADRDDTVAVFAAASLTDAVGELAARFEAANPGATVEVNLAGSSSLREQILDGAPADVFASASTTVMSEVVDAGLVDGRPDVMATNSLALAVPAGNPGEVTTIDDLADGDLLVGLCAAGVPCGDLARTALERVGVAAAVDTDEPDVRSLLAKLAAAELDAGLVYQTDLLGEPEVETVPTAGLSAVETRYPIAVIDSGGDLDLAQSFVAFVLSAEGRSILARWGFGTAAP